MWMSKRRRASLRLAGEAAPAIPPEQQKFSKAAVDRLKAQIPGGVVLYGDPNYQDARQLSNPAFQDFPQIIVYCKVFEDVRHSLRFAREHNLWVVCRSGGHSTAGYSQNTEMILDLSGLCYATVDVKAKRVTVGAGTNFGHLNSTLDTYRLHLPSGGCEDVNVAGYTQGGGFGFTSRKYGMHCDNMVEALVMLADGSMVTASKKVNPDLFWAIRGGTGNNFGVLLQAVYQLHDLWQVWGFGITWPLKNAAEALNAMQTGLHTAPPELGYMTMVTWYKDKCAVILRGMYCGSREEGMKRIQSLLRTPGAKLDIDKTGSYFEMNRYLLENPDLPIVPDIAAETKDCAYVDKPLGVKGWQRIVDAIQKTSNESSMLLLEPYGGKIAEIKTKENAFIHRKVDFDMALDVFWMNEDERRRAEAFLDGFFQDVEDLTNGHKYQNYPRRGNPNYRWNYWGDSFSTLLAVKKKYDPTNFFHYGQSVSDIPETADPSIRRPSPRIVISTDDPIHYETYSDGNRGHAHGAA